MGGGKERRDGHYRERAISRVTVRHWTWHVKNGLASTFRIGTVLKKGEKKLV